MKSNLSENSKKTSPCYEFKIGDLVSYCPHYGGDDGWVMKSELGLVIGVRFTHKNEKWQIVTVRWINEDNGVTDMASQMVKKVTLDK